MHQSQKLSFLFKTFLEKLVLCSVLRNNIHKKKSNYCWEIREREWEKKKVHSLLQRNWYIMFSTRGFQGPAKWTLDQSGPGWKTLRSRVLAAAMTTKTTTGCNGTTPPWAGEKLGHLVALGFPLQPTRWAGCVDVGLTQSVCLSVFHICLLLCVCVCVCGREMADLKQKGIFYALKCCSFGVRTPDSVKSVTIPREAWQQPSIQHRENLTFSSDLMNLSDLTRSPSIQTCGKTGHNWYRITHASLDSQKRTSPGIETSQRGAASEMCEGQKYNAMDREYLFDPISLATLDAYWKQNAPKVLNELDSEIIQITKDARGTSNHPAAPQHRDLEEKGILRAPVGGLWPTAGELKELQDQSIHLLYM